MEDTKSRFKRICVFCGSSSGKKPTYQEAAVELGKELVMKFSQIFFFSICFSCLFFRIRSFERQSQIFLHFVSGFNQSCIVSFNGAILASKKFLFFFSSLFPCPSLKGIFFYALFMFLINWVDFCSGIKQFRNLVVSLSFERGHMIVLLIK